MKTIRLTQAFTNNNKVEINPDNISFFYESNYEGHKCTTIAFGNDLKLDVKEGIETIIDLTS